MSQPKDQQKSGNTDLKRSRVRPRRWMLVLLILPITYGVSVLEDMYDGMSALSSVAHSAVTLALVSVFLLVVFTYRKHRGRDKPCWIDSFNLQYELGRDPLG